MGAKFGLSFDQRQTQRMEQRLSPQVIQYIKLLAKTTLELEQRIKEEMEENPLLEEGTFEEETPTAEAAATDDPEAEAPREEEWDWDYLNSADDPYGYKARVDHSDEEQREMPTPYQSTMSEHLMDQLSLLGLDEKDRLIAEQIIGSIDEDGYLRRNLEAIADDLIFMQRTEVRVAEVENILSRIQHLDPVGIAARDLRECLLIQLEVLPENIPGRDVAIEMLEKHYKAFTMKHFDQILRRMDLSREDLQTAFTLIQRLDPKPGEGNFAPAQNYIVPDFTVYYENGDFVITLNGRNAPPLRISSKYRSMLDKLSAEQKNGKKAESIDRETRQFLKNKFESARWFISSIEQRRQTMSKVMEAIVHQQAEFFRLGPGNLKPMILKDVADEIQMDISTVSRVVNGKYVQTNFGIYELKYFFSEGLATQSGEEVSNKEVKALIQGIIDKENKRKPLSDQRIATMLEAKGFHIARRTVSKYREQLGIPVARMRKEIVLG